MDDNARRQTRLPVTAPSQEMVQHPDAQRWSNGTGAGRHPPGRGIVGADAYSGYYQQSAAAFSPAMPPNTMSYQSGHEQVTPQAHNFRAYPSPMYNVPQIRVQSTIYDTNQLLPLYHPTPLRWPTGMAPSWFLSELANTDTASALPAQEVSSGAAEVDQSGPAGESAALEGQSRICTNIRNGVLASASESLLAVSDWLLSNVTELGSPGLATDNPRLYHDRIKLWHDFNHAWLALLQKQNDMVGSGIPTQGARPE
ncbi:uncharacterized protein PG986_015005 [Apiospora aurea]|uniref:Uncharacterized protein n=1 Tax=Apiospora aurea TaxID=335848 RepID=A0ABR1PUN2_9PEZI